MKVTVDINQTALEAAVKRTDQWRAISWQGFWLANGLNELIWLLQMLGREDVALWAYDQALNMDSINIQAGKPSDAVDDLLHSMVWRSYTWILSAYELVRTINQRLDSRYSDSAFVSKFSELKKEFARIRIPLAKFEPAKKHKATDYTFPRGCMQPGRGLCWAVADNVVISRTELSDALIALLLDLKSDGERMTDHGK